MDNPGVRRYPKVPKPVPRHDALCVTVAAHLRWCWCRCPQCWDPLDRRCICAACQCWRQRAA